MSYDCYIFSNQLQPVTREQLVTALGRVGFESDVYEEIHTPKLIEGNIAGYCTVLGWSKNALGRTALNEALRPGNRIARDKLFTDEVLAYCNIYVSPAHEFLANFDSDYFERPDGQASPEAIAAAKDSLNNPSFLRELS